MFYIYFSCSLAFHFSTYYSFCRKALFTRYIYLCPSYNFYCSSFLKWISYLPRIAYYSNLQHRTFHSYAYLPLLSTMLRNCWHYCCHSDCCLSFRFSSYSTFLNPWMQSYRSRSTSFNRTSSWLNTAILLYSSLMCCSLLFISINDISYSWHFCLISWL